MNIGCNFNHRDHALFAHHGANITSVVYRIVLEAFEQDCQQFSDFVLINLITI